MASDAFVDQPFKDREHVIAEIKLCARAGSVVTYPLFLCRVRASVRSWIPARLGACSFD